MGIRCLLLCLVIGVYGEESATNLTSKLCVNRWTCENISKDIEYLCNCDEKCDVFGDCCTDVIGTVEETEIPWQCRHMPGINTDSEIPFVFMVSECPLHADGSTIRSRCENDDIDDVFMRTPVSGRRTGRLYKNMFCSMCHGEHFDLWFTGVHCGWRHRYKGNFTLEELQNNTDCQIIYEPPSPDATIRPCIPFVDTCTNESSAAECQVGDRALVFNENEVYKNIDCAKCNGVLLEELSCSISNFIRLTNRTKKKRINYSFRLLVDLHTQTGSEIQKHRSSIVRQRDYQVASICQESQVYDPFTLSCRTILCLSEFVYKNGKCVQKETLGTTTAASREDGIHMPCPYIRFNQTEYNITNTGQIFILSSEAVYSANESYVGDNFVLVCVSKLISKTNSGMLQNNYGIALTFNSAESILSILLQSFSILTLCFSLIVYICLPKLHNVPGRNLICLMSSLLTAQTFFITSPFAVGTQMLCILMAIIEHYSFLASFCWMNVMAVDIFLTFSKGLMKSGESGKSTKLFVMYSLYSWSVPFFIAAAAFSVDNSSEGDLRPRYGEELCWINSAEALLYFFLVPTFILVFSNIFFFAFTAKSIYTTQKNTSKILRRKQTCKLLIYLKLSMVMGLTWILAGVATFSNTPVLWYIFVVLNASQGILIFVSFVCTPKIWRMVRKSNCILFYKTRPTSVTSSTTKSQKTISSAMSRTSNDAS